MHHSPFLSLALQYKAVRFSEMYTHFNTQQIRDPLFCTGAGTNKHFFKLNRQFLAGKIGSVLSVWSGTKKLLTKGPLLQFGAKYLHEEIKMPRLLLGGKCNISV